MQPYQRRILGRIADEIDEYHAGRRTMLHLLNNAWGMFEAAEIGDPDEHATFTRLYYAVSNADDALNPALPEGFGSEEDVAKALVVFEVWVRELRDGDPDED